MVDVKRVGLGALVGIVALHAACGGGEPQEQTTPVCMGLPTDPCVLAVSEPGFVHSTAVVTDGVSTGTVRHTPGRFCMSGKLDPGPTNMNWGSLMVLALTERTATGIAAPFGAAARGIAQVKFTVDAAPVAGLAVEFSAVQRADCLTIPDCFTAASFVLMEDGSTMTIVEETGTVTASLSSFKQPSWGDPALAFDMDLISALHFVPQRLPGVVLDYDFCVENVKFLDAGGHEMAP